MSCCRRLLVGLLLSGCAERAAPAPPALHQVIPSDTFGTGSTALQLRGAQFFTLGALSLLAGPGQDDRFQVFVGEVPLQSVTRVDSTRVDGVLPAGAPEGLHRVRLVDPWGREATLEAAFTVRRRRGAQLRATGSVPASIQEGSTAVATVQVTNEGDTAATGVRVDSLPPTGTGAATLFAQSGAQPLEPGATGTWTLQFRATGVGSVSFPVAVAGTDDFSGEPLTADRLVLGPLEIFSPPVLVATAALQPSVLGVGEVLALSAVVTNAGTTEVQGFQPSAVAQGDAGFTGLSVPLPVNLAPRASHTFDFRFTAERPGEARFSLDGQGTAPGTSLPAFLSPLSVGPVRVLTLPQLSGTSVATPAQVAPGEAVMVELLVRNDGEEDADQVVVMGSATGSGGATPLSSPGAQAVAAGASVSFQLSFQATQAGSLSFASAAMGLSRGGRRLVLMPAAISAAVVVSAVDGGTDAGLADAGLPDAGRSCDGGSCPLFCDPALPGLRACYGFEGVFTDGSPSGNHGTAASGRFESGATGLAWFPGDAGVTVRDHSSLDCTTAFTLEAWVFLTAFPGSGGRFGLIDNDGQYGMFIGPGGELRCSGSASLLVPAAVTLNAWQHLACTRDPAELKAYRDGLEVGSTASMGTLTTGNTNGLTIGQNSPDGDVLVGGVDGVRVWCEALTPSQLCTTPGGCG